MLPQAYTSLPTNDNGSALPSKPESEPTTATVPTDSVAAAPLEGITANKPAAVSGDMPVEATHDETRERCPGEVGAKDGEHEDDHGEDDDGDVEPEPLEEVHPAKPQWRRGYDGSQTVHLLVTVTHSDVNTKRLRPPSELRSCSCFLNVCSRMAQGRKVIRSALCMYAHMHSCPSIFLLRHTAPIHLQGPGMTH